MTAHDDDFQYAVAISFLGEDLGVAEQLASLLRERMDVFLFTQRQSEVAGSDGVDLLTSVFSRQARLVVILYRAGWGETPWTRVEEDAIKNRAFREGWNFLLVIPLAGSAVPAWIPRPQIWLSYERYGLATAVAVLERKLEEVGGEAKPATALSHVQELARRGRWQEERERRRHSEEGVKLAWAHIKQLLDELERAVKGAAKGSSRADVAFQKERDDAARLWTQSPDRAGTTVTIFFRSYVNTLNESSLRIRAWRGFASVLGQVIAFEQPKELESHTFDFEYTQSGQWRWQEKDTKQLYDTEQLAAYCMRLLIDHSRS